jgi:hypothetical protein
MIVNRHWRNIALAVGLVLLGAVIPVRALAASSSASNTSHAAADSAGRLHIVTASEVSGKFTLVYQILDPFAAVKDSETVLLRESTDRIRRPQIVVDRRGGVHVLWQERFAKAEGARDAQGTWVHYARFNNGELGGGLQHRILNDRARALHPDLAVDARGNAVVVWEESEALVVSRILPSGLVSARRLAVETSSLDRRAFPAIATDRQGQIHLAWTDHAAQSSDQIVYTVLAGQTLAPSIDRQTVHQVSGVYAQRKSLALEPTGSVRLSWTDKLAAGRLAERSDRNRVWIVAGGTSGTVVRTYGLADRHFNQESLPLVSDAVAVLPSRDTEWTGLRPSGAGDAVVPSLPEQIPALFSSAIEKELKREILAYASWSGPPPSAAIEAAHSAAYSATAPSACDLPARSKHPQSTLERQSHAAPGLFPAGALSV